MAPSHLPQELVDLIVDNFRDDMPSLKSCSLAARTFSGSVRAHIFRTVEITPPVPGKPHSPCQQLYKLLTSTPHVAPLIDELHIVLDLVEQQVPWIMIGRTLSLVLPLLDLKRISIVENGSAGWNAGGRFSMDWNKLGRTLKAALTDVFSSPRLQSVHLRGIVVQSPSQLLSLFSEATALKELSLSRVYFTQRQDEHKPWPQSQPWRPQLRSILVSDFPGKPLSCYLINHQMDLTHLRSLRLTTTQWRSEILQVIKSSRVEHLKLCGLHLHVYRPVIPLISPQLRSIHFFTLQTFPFLAALYQECSHDTRLETIIFEGLAQQPNSDQALDLIVESTVAQLRHFQRVEIKACIRVPSHTTFSAWSAAVRSSLPSLVSRGMLTLTEIPSSWTSFLRKRYANIIAFLGAEYDARHGWE
ncbi:hypothetical protein C8R44DRAFT_257652 [Mycena epipterygia]|nr:hypothetical protein C8R44DRAFT_257652 [Mycena epipterygia]